MQTLEELQRKIDGARELESVVKTMKLLATVNIRQMERAVDSFAQYGRTIELGLQILLQNRQEETVPLQPPADGRLGAVVIGSGQGLAGQFNQQIARFSLEELDRLGVPPPQRLVLALGELAFTGLVEAGQPVTAWYELPSSLPGVYPLAREVLIKLEQWLSQGEVSRVFLFYHRPLSGSSSFQPRARSLMPIDLEWLRSLELQPWQSRTLPSFTMDWQPLFSALIRQYFFTSVYKALVESLASENASRLAAMRLAQKHIEERLERLQGEFNQQRQGAITAEILELVNGFEAIAGSGPWTGMSVNWIKPPLWQNKLNAKAGDNT